MAGDSSSKVNRVAPCIRHVSTLAFDFEDLFRRSDEAILQRFRVTQRVNPNVVPQDLRADACQITRDLNGITLHFFRTAGPETPAMEIFRFTFKAPSEPI